MASDEWRRGRCEWVSDCVRKVRRERSLCPLRCQINRVETIWTDNCGAGCSSPNSGHSSKRQMFTPDAIDARDCASSTFAGEGERKKRMHVIARVSWRD